MSSQEEEDYSDEEVTVIYHPDNDPMRLRDGKTLPHPYPVLSPGRTHYSPNYDLDDIPSFGGFDDDDMYIEDAPRENHPKYKRFMKKFKANKDKLLPYILFFIFFILSLAFVRSLVQHYVLAERRLLDKDHVVLTYNKLESEQNIHSQKLDKLEAAYKVITELKNEINNLNKKLDKASQNPHTNSKSDRITVDSSELSSYKDIINELMNNNNEHFKSYDSLIPQLELVSLQTNESEKNIEILKNGFLLFANETKTNISHLQTQMNNYNEILKQYKKMIDSIQQNNNKNNNDIKDNNSNNNNNNEIMNEYKSEMNQNIDTIKDTMKNIENEMKMTKGEIDNLKTSFNERIDGLISQQQQQSQKPEPSLQINDELLLSNENTTELIKIINQLISDKMSQIYTQDSIGKPDYALYVTGTRIIHNPLYTSETYHADENILQRIANKFGLGLTQNSPEIVIQPFHAIGDCWAFNGGSGNVTIQLGKPLIPTSFTIEHIPKSIAINIDSAPKTMKFIGYRNEDIIELTGNITYDINSKNPQQEFVAKKINDPIEFVQLQIYDNWGNKDFTCLYRFRVHSN